MTCTVKIFGPLAAAAGDRELVVQTDQNQLTCTQLRALLTRQIPQISALLPACRFAINHAYAEESQVIRPEDEVALIGLVSGG
ncbi:MAG: MoaD/ThiS family protein [Phycisphaerae bacterium]